MATINLANVYAYSGGLLNVSIGSTETVLLSDLTLVDPATIEDDDLILDQGDDGVATLNGSTIDYVGSGSAGLLGLPLVSEEIVIFNSGSTTYFYFPNGQPTGASLTMTVDMDSTGPTALRFAEGTLIDTTEGIRKVESLKPGDLVLTHSGQVAPVKWIGRQTVHTAFRPAERLQLIRFAPGSLGQDLPRETLTVTADHGMLIDGVICHAGALVNDCTITRVPRAELGERYTVYHVETEAHEIILAEGAPTETFIDNVSRRAFDNYAEFEALYGEVPEMEELPYPRAMSARQVPKRIRRRLMAIEAA